MAAFARKYRISGYCSSKSNCSLYHYFSTSIGKAIKIPNSNTHLTRELLVEKYQFSLETASSVISISTRSLTPKNSDLVLSFLKQSGFTNTQLDKIVRCKPRLLCSSLEKTIKPKIDIFQDLGFSAVEIAEIVTADPSILNAIGINRIIPSLTVLKGMLGSHVQVAKLLMKPGWFMEVDLEKTLLPNIEFLKSCGVYVGQINSLLYAFPNFFTLNPENMRRCVQKVDKIGVDRTSKLFIYAVRAVSSMADATWELKLQTFRDLGFSEDDILRVFREAPGVLSISGRRMKRVKEAILETGKYDMSCIVNCPTSLTYSVEMRYKPRFEILKDLESRGLINKWPTLGTLSRLTNEEFFKKFVALNANNVNNDLVGQTD